MAGTLIAHHGFDHTQGKSVWGMQYTTAVMSGNEGIFPLNLDLKTKNGLSRIVMQMAVIKRAITAGLRFVNAGQDLCKIAEIKLIHSI